MSARIAGFAPHSNQTLQFQNAQLGRLPNQINALGVVQGRLFMLVELSVQESDNNRKCDNRKGCCNLSGGHDVFNIDVIHCVIAVLIHKQRIGLIYRISGCLSMLRVLEKAEVRRNTLLRGFGKIPLPGVL
jgi:hypothetical protein